MIVDCDDILAPSALDLLYNEAINSDAEIVAGQILKKYSKDSAPAFDTLYITNKQLTNVKRRPSILQDGMYLGKLFQRSLLQNNRIFMDPKLLYADRPFVNTAQALSNRVLLIPFITYHWRQRESDNNLSITDQEHSISHLKDRVYSILVICDELKSRNKEFLLPFINEHNHKRIFWHFKKMNRDNFRLLREFAIATKPYIETVNIDNAKHLTEYQKHVSLLVQKYNHNIFPWVYHLYALKRNIKLITSRIINTAKNYFYKKIKPGRFKKYAKSASPDYSLVVFESFFGKSYSGNPKYIYEALLRSNKHFRAVWVYQGKKLEIPGQVIQVDRGTEDYYRYIAKAAYIVNNITFTLDYKAPHTTYLQTWHGTPLKRLGLDIEIKDGPELDARKNLLKEAKKWDYLIAANEFSEEKFSSAFDYSNKILTGGYPANDLFYHPKADELSNDLKLRLGIADKKVILYAPTWRDNNKKQGWNFGFDLNMNLARLRKTLGREYVLLLRMHHLISDQMNTSKFKDFVLDVSKFDDAHELLLISDILITDYSSIFFDYANLNRPMIFYSYDLEQYDSELRGFYINPRKELPGPLVENETDLIKAIQQIDSLEGEFAQKRKKFIERFCSLEDGNCSERIVNEVFNDLPDIDGSGDNKFRKAKFHAPSYNPKYDMDSVSPYIQRNNKSLIKYMKSDTSDESLVVFESFFGKFYGGEPKYIYQSLLNSKKSFTAVWVYQKIEHNLPPEIIQVKRGTDEYFRYLATAKYWVNNLKFSLTEKPLHTKYIQTWIGTPLKKLGTDIMNNESIDFTTHHDFLLEAKNWDTMLAGCEYAKDKYISGFGFSGKIMTDGLPSSLAYKNHSKADTILKIKNKLSIPQDKKVILYAPTFRDTNITEAWSFTHKVQLELSELKELFPEYVFLIKLHSFVSETLDLSLFPNFAFDVSDYNDSHELQIISDMLITDYSSILFEYANLERPIIFYCYDNRNYGQYRGLYLDHTEDLPGPTVTSFEELVSTIRNIDSKYDTYKTTLKSFKKTYCKKINLKTANNIINELFPELS